MLSQEKRKKTIAASLGAVLAASALIPVASIAAESNFPDVPTDHKYFTVIHNLVETGVISGYPDGAFKMGEKLTRAEATHVIASLLNMNEDAPITAFTDVKDDVWYTNSINALYQNGAISGYSETIFQPNVEMTRAEYAQLIVQAYNIPAETTDLPFNDVKKDAWYESAIQTLYANDLIDGRDATTFAPNDPIKRGDGVWLLSNVDTKFGNGAEPEELFELSIIHTNDTHANLDNAPKRATIINDVREEKPDALLLDAGDVFQGTLYFTEYQGQADLALMNYMEYDAMTLGNHEFDLGRSEDGHQALADFVTGATFPIITANVDFSLDEKLADLHQEEISTVADPGNIYDGIILEVDGEQIGLFGLTTETTAGSSSPEKVVFENYIEEAEKAVASFEEQGIDKIIAITHLGFDNPINNNDLLLAESVDGIDIIVGGHSHTTLTDAVVVDTDVNGDAKDPTVIVQTGSNSDNVGTLDVEFDENGVIIGHANQLIAIGDQEDDPGAAEILAPFTEGIAAVQNLETGGIALNALPNPRTGDPNNEDGLSVRNSETALGNLVADSMLAQGKTIAPNATIAFQNGGGVRGPVDQGPITMGDVLTVLSFNNGLYSVDLTGSELRQAIEGSVSAVPTESGSFLHVAGLKIEFDSSKPVGERVISIEAADTNGIYAPIVNESLYTVITNSYIALGNGYNGSFSSAAADDRATDIGLSDWESFAAYLKATGEVDPQIEGRVVNIAN